MKKVIIKLISIIAIIYLLCEPEAITTSIIIYKAISLLWLWLVAKANKYFYQGE